MKSRALLIGLAAVLAGSAFFVERISTSLPVIGSGGAETTSSGTTSSANPGQSPHEFAILEMGMGEVPVGSVALRFRVSVTEGNGPAVAYDIEPSETGLVQFGPLKAGAEVVVSVVAGGAICGFEGEETIGEARVRITGALGRQFVIVPVRTPSPTPRRHRIEVVDADEWAVEGARILSDGVTTELRTSVLGFVPFDSTWAPRIRVIPPPTRPDLVEEEVRVEPKDWMTLVTLDSLPARAIEIPELSSDFARASIDRIRLEPVDSRNWSREFRVHEARVEHVRIGTYRATWDVAGMRRRGVLTVERERVHFEESGPPVPLRQVEIGGSWQAFAMVPMQFVVLAGRTVRSVLTPSRVLSSRDMETFDGLNFTTPGRFGGVEDDGRIVFPDMAPGAYEFAIIGRPRYASLCLVVPETEETEVVRRVAHPVAAAGVGDLYGTVAGQAHSKPYHVEVRAVGQFEAMKPVKVGESYEFGELSPGVYAVRVVRSDAFEMLRSTGDCVRSTWRNVIVDAGLRVKLDFAVE